MIINSEILTSRANPFVKLVSSLRDKKAREVHRSFIAEGIKLTIEALSADLPVSHVVISSDKKDKYLNKILSSAKGKKGDGATLVTVSPEVFEKCSTEKAPEGVIAVIKYLDFFFNMDIIYKEEFFLKEGERAIALSSVRDPSNLGSVVRSAVAFGVDTVVLSEDCTDPYSPRAVRSAMGSLFRVRIVRVSDFSSFVSALRAHGRRLLTAELREGAKSLKEISLKKSDVFVIGNEGHGISPEISELSDGSVYIPISGKTESLNASVAAAVFMWEQDKL